MRSARRHGSSNSNGSLNIACETYLYFFNRKSPVVIGRVDMRLLRSLIEGWGRWRDVARREFLRDPNVILFERAAPEQEERRQ